MLCIKFYLRTIRVSVRMNLITALRLANVLALFEGRETVGAAVTAAVQELSAAAAVAIEVKLGLGRSARTRVQRIPAHIWFNINYYKTIA